MKRLLWYLTAVAAVLFLSGAESAGMDIGKLQPVQVVLVAEESGTVLVSADTGEWGSGEDLAQAMKDLQTTSSLEVFLETADYLLISPNCEDLLPSMKDYLRPSCVVCVVEGQPDLMQVGQFLQRKKPKVTLLQYDAGERVLETLFIEEGRMYLVSE